MRRVWRKRPRRPRRRLPKAAASAGASRPRLRATKRKRSAPTNLPGAVNAAPRRRKRRVLPHARSRAENVLPRRTAAL